MQGRKKAILIFGIPDHKDECGSGAYDENGITQRAVRHIKEKCPDMIVIADVCLCEYTSHGHCGLIHNGEILNDETLPLLAKMAVSLAKAGADIIAPSEDDMERTYKGYTPGLMTMGTKIHLLWVQCQICLRLLFTIQGCCPFISIIWRQKHIRWTQLMEEKH